GFNFVPFAHKSSDGSSGQLTAAIRWLNTSRNARILSAPNVIAAQGAEATITTAEELPIPESSTNSSSTNLSIKYKQVGVTLKITPELINEKTVQLSVNPQVRSVLRYEAFSMNDVISNIPVISLRSVDTKLTVADGDIIILGGLYNSEKSETLRKVPYLGDIPVLGDLINGRDSSSVDKQLLFLLKVHIIQPGKMISLDPDATAHEIHKTAEILEQSRQLFTNKPATKFVDVEGELNEEAKRRREKLENERAVLQELEQIVEEKKKEGK
ncbi:MAG: type II and III secretion system protein, partial [Lentisphaeria bacterium]|nr:type II and III secretion system protein [Lentisphaeria bacterium]